MSETEQEAPVVAAAAPEPTLEEYEALLAARRRHLVAADQPVVLISQAPRSGGTLLLRLLDGHPELHVPPHELRFDFKKFPEDPALAWSLLHDASLAGKFRQGYMQSHTTLHGDRTRFPLLIPPSFQRALYEEALAGLERPSERDLRNAYLTSFFNAWLDNQNLYCPVPKRWVVIHTPRLIASEKKMENVRSAYPDGHVISVIRDPLSWFASARRWSWRGEWSRPDDAMDRWCRGAARAIEEQRAEPRATTVVAFDDLLTRTHETMAVLCDRLGIRLVEEVMSPSLNNLLVRANSSFAEPSTDVSTSPLGRHKGELSAEEQKYARRRGWPLYEEALALASRPGRRAGRLRPLRRS